MDGNNLSEVFDISESPNGDEEFVTQKRHYDHIQTIIVAIVLSSIIMITIIMNILIIMSFCISKDVRKLNNYFYLSLAITDLFTGLIVMPFMATELLLGDWPYGKTVCQFWLCVDYFLLSASRFNMTGICIDRYLSILHPLSYRCRRTPLVIVIMIISAWFLGFLTDAPAILFWEHARENSVVNYTHTCDVEWLDNITYNIVSTVITVCIPLVVMFVLYCRIYIAVRKSVRWVRNNSYAASAHFNAQFAKISDSRETVTDSARNSPGCPRSAYSSSENCARSSAFNSPRIPRKGENCASKMLRHSRGIGSRAMANDRKTATTLGILLGFYILSWLPWQLISIVNASCSDYCVPVIWYDVFLWLQYSNSMVNPFLYIFRDKSFRRSVKMILRIDKH